MAKYSSLIGLKVAPEVKRKIDEVADQQLTTTSHVVRVILTQWVKEQENAL